MNPMLMNLLGQPQAPIPMRQPGQAAAQQAQPAQGWNDKMLGLLGNPMFRVGVSLLGTKEKSNAINNALGGLQGASDFQTQQSMLGQKQAEAEQRQKLLELQTQQAEQGLEGYRLMSPEEVEAAGLPSGYGYQVGPNGQISTLGSNSFSAPSTFAKNFTLAQQLYPELTRDQQYAKAIEMTRSLSTFGLGGGGIAQDVPGSDQPKVLVSPEEATGRDAAAEGAKAGAKTATEETIKRGLDKKEEMPAAKAKLEAVKSGAESTVGKIDNVIGRLSGKTTGLLGSLAANVRGTEAFDVAQELETIKANIGFDKLQQMREFSKTGGALGNVAVQELNSLQKVLGSLEQGQSPEQLAKNLRDIREHYTRLMDLMQRIYDEKYGPASGQPVPEKGNVGVPGAQGGTTLPADVESELDAVLRKRGLTQ